MCFSRGYFVQRQGHPIGIGVFVGVRKVFLVIIRQQILTERGEAVGTVAGIVPAEFVDQLHVALRAHIIGQLRRRIKSIFVAVLNRGLIGFGSFGRNQNYPRSRPRTVNRSRSRIFQDRQVFNVVGVDLIYIAYRYAIHNHQRVGISDGGHASDSNRGTSHGAVGPVAGYHYARHSPLEGLCDLGFFTLLKHLAIDG